MGATCGVSGGLVNERGGHDPFRHGRIGLFRKAIVGLRRSALKCIFPGPGSVGRGRLPSGDRHRRQPVRDSKPPGCRVIRPSSSRSTSAGATAPAGA